MRSFPLIESRLFFNYLFVCFTVCKFCKTIHLLPFPRRDTFLFQRESEIKIVDNEIGRSVFLEN